MKERHIALIVEDDAETAEDLVEILKSIDCQSVVVDNVEDAETALQNRSFCLILLDLEIKGRADSIKGHVEHGRSLLRTIRTKHGEHNGNCFSLPVLIVSGFAREVDSAVDVMKDGASDVIQKPLESSGVSGKIRHALQKSGRPSHDACGHLPRPRRANLEDGIVLAVPGDRIRRRTRITVSGNPVDLTDASLKIFLHLLVALQDGAVVNKADFGASAEQGFKGVSILRAELKLALGDLNIVENRYHGDYCFLDGVTIGGCAYDKLRQIGDAAISELAERLEKHLSPPAKTV
jgi:DNA-binding response OmpR family regulator